MSGKRTKRLQRLAEALTNQLKPGSPQEWAVFYRHHRKQLKAGWRNPQTRPAILATLRTGRRDAGSDLTEF